MRRPQAVKFWQELEDSTDATEVIERLKGKIGYASSRTLQRYAQAHSAFRNGESLEDLSRKTSWSINYLNKIHAWWVEWRTGVPAAIPQSAVTTTERLPRFDSQKHWDNLMQPLLDLLGVEPLPVHDYDLALWHFRRDKPDWPIAKGRMMRDSEGRVEIQLEAESNAAWKPLKSHLTADPVWKLIESWEEGMAQDISVRLELLETIIHMVERPPDKGGAGLSVTDWDQNRSVVSAVGTYYIFTIYDQLFSKALGLSHMPKTRRDFFSPSPDIVQLGSHYVISSPDEKERELAIDFLLSAQEGLVPPRDFAKAVKACRLVEQATNDLKKHMELLKLGPAFPPGSSCSLCLPFLEPLSDKDHTKV